MTLVKPTDKTDKNGVTYTEVKCGTVIGGDNVCSMPKGGNSKPVIFKVNPVKSTTFIKDGLDNAKIDLSALKSVGKVSGIYTVGFSEGVETLIYVKHAGGTHTIHVKGHYALTQDLFVGNDSTDLIEGLVTKKGDVDYYNLLCGMQRAENKCIPVKIDGVEKPTGYLLDPSVSARTVVHNSESLPFFFNLKLLEDKKAVNANDKVDPRFDNKVDFYHGDKVVHTAIIESPNDMMTGLLNIEDTYVY